MHIHRKNPRKMNAIGGWGQRGDWKATEGQVGFLSRTSTIPISSLSHSWVFLQRSVSSDSYGISCGEKTTLSECKECMFLKILMMNFRLFQRFYSCKFLPELRYKSPLVYRAIVNCFYCLLSLPDSGKFPSAIRISFLIFRLTIRHKFGFETSQTSITPRITQFFTKWCSCFCSFDIHQILKGDQLRGIGF